MRILDIFEIENCVCIEPTLMDHPEDGYTDMAIGLDADEGRLLVDENEEPVALALLSDERWVVSSYIYRDPHFGIIEKFEQCGGDIYQETRDDFADSLREYYCQDIKAGFPDVIEDNRPGRDLLVTELLEEVFGNNCGSSTTVTDFCCGSGVATSVLRSMGKQTLSFDLDASLISLGLQKGRLDPARTMCIDGRSASLFCPFSDICLGLMMGDINNINSAMWESMIGEMPEIGEKILITVATGAEAERVSGWLKEYDLSVSVCENTRDPIYDRFIIIAE